MKKKRRRSRAVPSEVPPKSMKEKVATALEVPLSAVGGTPQLLLSGNRELTVEGCKGILEYDEDIIRLNLGKLILRLTGRDLSLCTLTEDTAVVEGYLLSIEFLT